ncbi:hypothetical protein Glove_320g11 [Diversispora epigaea]|uniref:Uncharacterized protein n=1 Tax=Diversispora epigaea TaxID=1348612 RepID=A0A397HUJ6_9GLOM|nr:hypothetical protein Glove_320g11 [Diversispora epigaea]
MSKRKFLETKNTADIASPSPSSPPSPPKKRGCLPKMGVDEIAKRLQGRPPKRQTADIASPSPSSPPSPPKKRGCLPKMGVDEIAKRLQGRPPKRQSSDDDINNYNNSNNINTNNHNTNNILLIILINNNNNNNNNYSNNNNNYNNKGDKNQNLSGELFTSLSNKIIFGSGTKYTKSSLMEGFANILQPFKNNNEENNKASDMEEEVPFGTETNIDDNYNNNNNDNDNNNNEMADSLAKIPLIQTDQETIKIKHRNIKNRSYISIWNNIPMETPVKLIVKKYNQIKKRQKWKSQNRFQEIFVDQEKTQKIDWCTTFKTLHPSKITNDKTNREDQIKRSFAMKLLNEELPVMTRRFQHQPHIYKDPKCVLCGRYEENNLHVFECKRNNNDPEYKPMIKHYEKLIEYLTDKTYEKTKDISRKTINTILKSISELYLWNIDDQDQRTFHHVNLYDVIRGLIPHSLINKVAKTLRSKIKAREAVFEGICKFKEYLHKCWKERCERVIEWELQNNITNKVKQRKDKNNNNNNNNINREEDNIDTELTKEINRNRDNQIIAREEKKKIERETKKIIERYTVHNLETWIEYGKNNKASDMEEEVPFGTETNIDDNYNNNNNDNDNNNNEMADSLAKIPLIQTDQETIKIKHRNIKNRSYISIWNNIPMETPVKLIVKKYNQIKKRQKWKSQNRFQEIFVDQEKTQKIDWCTTFKTLHPSKITNDKTNREDQIKRSFAMKLLNEELPVMTRRFQHQPHIYKDPKCVLCGRYEENNLHVFECKRNNNDPEYKPMIKHYEKLIEYLTDKTYEKTKDISRKTINTILKSISELYLWNIDDQDQRTFHHVNLYDVIRGLIPHSLINKVAKTLRSKIKAREAVFEGICKFKEYLHKYWKERCERVIEWELQNNITNKVKQRKDKNNNNNNNNINREEDNIDTELTKEINRNRDNQIIAREEKKKIERETKKIIERYTVHNLETWIEYGSYYNTNYCYRYLNFKM